MLSGSLKDSDKLEINHMHEDAESHLVNPDVIYQHDCREREVI